jgi:DNA-binding LytR/AlgR family response regulator
MVSGSRRLFAPTGATHCKWTPDRSTRHGYLLRESLSQLERRVTAHGFARAHRHAPMRLDGVRALQTTAAGDATAVLACGANVPVSRRRRTAFAAAVRSAAAT